MKDLSNKNDVSLTPFIDCLGSYFLYFYNLYSTPNYRDDLYLYLINHKLSFLSLNGQEIYQKFGDNPWGYQPVQIFDFKDNLINLEEPFYKYLEEKFNLKTHFEYEDALNDKDIIEQIINRISSQSIIVSMDEYFVPHSTNFYMKKHNDHDFLVKELNITEQKIEFYDTEFSESYKLNFSDIKTAFHKSSFSKMYYCIEGKEYHHNVDYCELLETFVGNLMPSDYLNPFIDEINEKLINLPANYMYYFKGFHFSILFKIIPVVKSRYHLFQNFCGKPTKIEPLLPISSQIVSTWENISLIMLRSIVKGNLSNSKVQNITSLISHIVTLEDEFYKMAVSIFK